MPPKGWKSVNIRDALFNEIDKAAQKENPPKSVSNYVNEALIDHLYLKGYIPKREVPAK